MRIISIITLLSICSCGQIPDNDITTPIIQKDSSIKSDSHVSNSDISLDTHTEMKNKPYEKLPVRHKVTKALYTRMEEVPNDDSFNGKPMTQQLELYTKVLQAKEYSTLKAE